jgi:hypothetical protein
VNMHAFSKSLLEVVNSTDDELVASAAACLGAYVCVRACARARACVCVCVCVCVWLSVMVLINHGLILRAQAWCCGAALAP